MALWFKYLHVLSEQRQAPWASPASVVTNFVAFCQCRQPMPAEFLLPLQTFAAIVVEHYANLAGQEQVPMCIFFDKVKSELLTRWESEIVHKSSQFTVSQ
jgi:hypothetical protein